MNWRLLVCVGAGFFAAFWAAVLMFNEEIVEVDARTKVEQNQQDVLFGMQFAASQREANFKKMGFSDDEVAAVAKKVGVLEEKYHTKDPTQDIVSVRIDAASDQDELAAALCGTNASLPVRYAAMKFLMIDRGSGIRAADLDEVSSLELQQWAKAARIEAVYEMVEAQAERKDDATRMGLAAIIAGSDAVDLVLTKKAPFGRGVFSGWDWAAVQKKFPGTKDKLIDYVALLHLVGEVANSDKGMCKTG